MRRGKHKGSVAMPRKKAEKKVPIPAEKTPTNVEPKEPPKPTTTTTAAAAPAAEKPKPKSDSNVETDTGLYNKPNKPCFDYNPGTMKPNIDPEENILIETVKKGIHIYVTSHGRAIYCCSIEEFEEKFRKLIPDRNKWAAWYPHATSDPPDAATIKRLTGQ
jgi:hypothetical protein